LFCAALPRTVIARSTIRPRRTCAWCIHVPRSNAYGCVTKASRTPLRRPAWTFSPLSTRESVQPQDRLTAIVRADVPLHVALVEPEIPPNTGNVARLCAATGCQLHLVEPLGFRIDDRELKRAGLDYWKHLGVAVHPSLDAFLSATAHMKRWYFSTRGKRAYTDAAFSLGDVLVFGKETKGLPQALIDGDPQHALRIPQRPNSVRSINLSTAVGIATYAALSALGFPGLQ